MQYARIIDKGECESTNPLVVDGVPANITMWKRYNFYPQNNMVGELMLVNGINVLHIMEDIYVVMHKGLEIISEEEWREGQQFNVCVGLDDKQWALYMLTQACLLKKEAKESPKQFATEVEKEAYEVFIATLFQILRGEELQQKKINSLAIRMKSSSLHLVSYQVAKYRMLSEIRNFLRGNGLEMDDFEIVSYYLCIYALAYNRTLGPIAIKEDCEIFNELYVLFKDNYSI